MIDSLYCIVSPGLEMGGVERASSNFANGLILNDPNKKVVFLSIFNKKRFFDIHNDILFLEPEDFNKSNLSLIKTIKFIRKTILDLQNSSKNIKIIVYGKFYGALVAMALFSVDVDIFISDRNSPLFKWQFPFNWINRIAYSINPPKGVIAQTVIAADYQRKYFRRSKVTVIPNSVREVKLYPEIPRENIILAVGRLNDHLKGFDLLLQAVAQLNNQDWEVHIAGGDGEGHALEKLAIDLGISHRVKFLGKIKDIDPLYAKAGIFVIPSRSEGFPNALAEAMAAGCCCVAFDFIAGPRDMIVHGENGLIVPNGDILALAKSIDELILDDGKREYLGVNARSIGEKLAQKVIVEKIKSFFESGV